MTQFDTRYPPANGYMTEKVKQKYIEKAVAAGVLPNNAHRMPEIISLSASSDNQKPIQFWQLYSVLGLDRIVGIVSNFYNRVYDDEQWFRSVFERISTKQHHINVQSSMWVDVMGGGPYYHGGEYRLSFHHAHNAIMLMNDRGAKRWAALMLETLNDPSIDMTDDPRVRPSINTFLSYFFEKYADEFRFNQQAVFAETNPPYKRRINFLRMSSDEIEALTETELAEALADRGIDISLYPEKQDLVNKALRL